MACVRSSEAFLFFSFLSFFFFFGSFIPPCVLIYPDSCKHCISMAEASFHATVTNSKSSRATGSPRRWLYELNVRTVSRGKL